jgi:predicted MPP superfamily phosphohydrolase
MKRLKMKILMNQRSHQNCHIQYNSLFIIPVLLLINTFCGFSQAVGDQQRIYFISDSQAPMSVEKIISKPYRNEEARDSLFADIIRQHPKNLFMLGDMISMGLMEKAWAQLDTFLNSLKKTNTSVYAIPGNHEYMGKYAGMRMFKQHFPEQWLYGYSVNLDSLSIVMLNSNFDDLNNKELSRQLTWYKSVMDSLDNEPDIKAIIVCTHHAPYSNSTIVGSSEAVEDLILPVFEKSQKSRLFISGHSHNLEYFSDITGKHFLVIGGGGGIAQPLTPMNTRKYHDLLDQDVKPLYFYLVIEKNGDRLRLIAKGFKKDFSFFESDIGIIPLN